MPADARFALHQVHAIARVGDFQRGLDARDAAADDQRIGANVHFHRFQRLMVHHTMHRRADQRFGFGRRRVHVVTVHPGGMFADVRHLEHVRVQPRAGASVAERLFVHVR